MEELVLQFGDDFKATGPLDVRTWRKLEHLDLDVWADDPAKSRRQPWQGSLPMYVERPGDHQVEIGSEGGHALVKTTTTMPAGPGVMAYGGFVTKDRHFNPGLSGTNVFEVSLLDYTPGGEFLNRWLTFYGNPGDAEDLVGGRYDMGWGLTIASFPGFITGREDRVKDRAVQLHFDGWVKYGWSSILCRIVAPGDQEKYPEFDHKTETYEAKPKPFVAQPCLILESRRDLAAEGSSPYGHRYGLGLTDNGDTVFWTLDGQEMGRADITGYFQSAPQAVQNGAYASVFMGGSYQSNIWKFAKAEVYVSQGLQ